MAEEKEEVLINEQETENERAGLVELWNKMKKHNEMESGETKESLLAKYRFDSCNSLFAYFRMR